MDFGDLVASAEQLTAEIDGARAGDLPRVERSLKHIVDAGQSLLGKSAGQGQDAKASILLGSRGVDLPAISSKIGAIQSTNILTESEKVGVIYFSFCLREMCLDPPYRYSSFFES